MQVYNPDRKVIGVKLHMRPQETDQFSPEGESVKSPFLIYIINIIDEISILRRAT